MCDNSYAEEIEELQDRVSQLEEVINRLLSSDNYAGLKDYELWRIHNNKPEFRNNDLIKLCDSDLYGVVVPQGGRNVVTSDGFMEAQVILTDTKGIRYLGNPTDWYAKHCELIERDYQFDGEKENG